MQRRCTRQMFTDWIASQVGDDPELLAKVVPDYPATGKRTLQDNGSWLRTLTRDNVELVRTGIDHIEPDAVVTVDGERHAADVIVYATGFHATTAAVPDGDHRPRRHRPAHEVGRRPAAYLGITVPSFPNLFCMYGPGTNLAHGGSLIFHSECQMRYITRVHRRADRRRTPRDRAAPGASTTTGTSGRRREIKTLVWSQPSIEALVLQERDGEIHGLSPWRLVDYWTLDEAAPTSTTSWCGPAHRSAGRAPERSEVAIPAGVRRPSRAACS